MAGTPAREVSIPSAVVGVLAGTLLSGFGPHVPAVVAAILFVVAAISGRARPLAGAFAVGLCVGLVVYVLLAVIQDPGSGSGSGTGRAN